jgi:hypothetical protein
MCVRQDLVQGNAQICRKRGEVPFESILIRGDFFIVRVGDLSLKLVQELPFEWHRGDFILEIDWAQKSSLSFKFLVFLVWKRLPYVRQST